MKEKVKIIDEITKHHPSIGVDKGWSTYVGGMADTGHWYFRKMLDVPTNELQAFLRDIILRENTPKTPLTEEELADSKKIIEPTPGVWMNVYQYKILQKWHEKLERNYFKPY